MIFSRLVLAGLLALETGSLASGIVAYAESMLGRKVGEGQCTDLASEASARQGACGAPMGELTDLRPGDILSFQDAEFRGRSREGARVRLWRLSFEQHVAIVTRAEVRGREVLVEIVHQNFRAAGRRAGEGEVVQQMTLNLGRLTRGEVRGYRPLPVGYPRRGPRSPA